MDEEEKDVQKLITKVPSMKPPCECFNLMVLAKFNGYNKLEIKFYFLFFLEFPKKIAESMLNASTHIPFRYSRKGHYIGCFPLVSMHVEIKLNGMSPIPPRE